MNKYDKHFSPISEEMSKQISPTTNCFLNNSFLIQDSENKDYMQNDSKCLRSLQRSKNIEVSPTYYDEQNLIDDVNIEDIKYGRYAEHQTPLEDDFNQQLQNALEGEFAENDLIKKDIISQKIIKKGKSKSRSNSPNNDILIHQQNHGQFVTQIPKKGKKKKSKIFIQEQPFKLDGGINSAKSFEYNAQQDKFLKNFFNSHRIKNIKKIERFKNPQKKDKSEKNILQDQNISLPERSSTNPQQRLGHIQELNNQISIETNYMSEINDNPKETSENSSYYNCGSIKNINSNWSGQLKPPLDKNINNFNRKHEDKENIEIKQYICTREISPKQQKKKQIDEKFKYVNKSTDLSQRPQENQFINYSRRLQNIQLPSPASNSLNQRQLPRLSTVHTQETPNSCHLYSGLYSSSSNGQVKSDLISMSQDLESCNEKQKNKKSLLNRQRFHSIYSNPRTESPLKQINTSYNTTSLSKPFCNLNGISVALPKQNKYVGVQQQQQLKNKVHFQLPSFNSQNQQIIPLQQRNLNLSLNISSSQQPNLAQLEQRISCDSVKNIVNQEQFQQHDCQIERTQSNFMTNKSNNKLNNSLSKDEFNNFMHTFKNKYKPQQNDSQRCNHFTKSQQQPSYESKLLKDYQCNQFQND